MWLHRRDMTAERRVGDVDLPLPEQGHQRRQSGGIDMLQIVEHQEQRVVVVRMWFALEHTEQHFQCAHRLRLRVFEQRLDGGSDSRRKRLQPGRQVAEELQRIVVAGVQ